MPSKHHGAVPSHYPHGRMVEAANPPCGAMAKTFGNLSGPAAETRNHPLDRMAEFEVLSHNDTIAHVESYNTIGTSAFLNNPAATFRLILEQVHLYPPMLLRKMFMARGYTSIETLGRVELRSTQFTPADPNSHRSQSQDQ